MRRKRYEGQAIKTGMGNRGVVSRTAIRGFAAAGAKAPACLLAGALCPASRIRFSGIPSWTNQAQRWREGVRQGVQMADCRGHRSRSAVFLVHSESLGQAPGGSTGTASARRLSVEDRRLSHRERERLVTGSTEMAGTKGTRNNGQREQGRTRNSGQRSSEAWRLSLCRLEALPAENGQQGRIIVGPEVKIGRGREDVGVWSDLRHIEEARIGCEEHPGGGVFAGATRIVD